MCCGVMAEKPFWHFRLLAAGGANAPAYWAPASLIRPTPKKTPIA